MYLYIVDCNCMCNLKSAGNSFEVPMFIYSFAGNLVHTNKHTKYKQCSIAVILYLLNYMYMYIVFV